jgi:hypothetical protein
VFPFPRRETIEIVDKTVQTCRQNSVAKSLIGVAKLTKIILPSSNKTTKTTTTTTTKRPTTSHICINGLFVSEGTSDGGRFSGSKAIEDDDSSRRGRKL